MTLWLWACGPQPQFVEAVAPTVTGIQARFGENEVAARSAWASPEGVVAHDVTVSVNESPRFEVTADVVDWRQANGTAVFEGHVRLVRGTLTLLADTLDAHVVGERVITAVAEGAVRVRREAWSAIADRATLDLAARTLALEGNLRMADAGRSVTAQRVTVWLDEDRVVCDACSIAFTSDPLIDP